MTDYAPVIPPAVVWSNSFSVPFCTLLSVLAAAKVVFIANGVVSTFPARSARDAKFLMTRELVARLNTGSAVHLPDYDALVDVSCAPVGQEIADDFAARATAAQYTNIGGLGVNRFSVPVPRGKPPIPDVTDLFIQTAAIAAYQVELVAVIAAVPQLVQDVAAQAALNVAQDPTAAASVAAALAASRAAYVSQLQAAYPSRGFV